MLLDKRVKNMTDYILDLEQQKNEDLDFTCREEQAFKRLPELRFNPKKKDSITDKIMNKIIWG